MGKEQRYQGRLRQEGIAAYGGRCACCGDSHLLFLTLEHVMRDGREHRRQSGKDAGACWRDLKRRGYPKNGYEVLCMNCNWGTRYGQQCPHETERRYIPPEQFT